jgi:flagellar hook protein FlgE
LLTAFNTALSALQAESTAISVVGNNLANLNTTGFKADQVTFADLMSETLSAGGSTQIGTGVGTPFTLKNFSQDGAPQTSTNPLAVAIQGQGFLLDRSASGALLYTRDGNLSTDQNGTLQNSEGEAIQGWMNLTFNGGPINTSGPVGNIVIPMGSLVPGQATGNLGLNMNLDATAAVGSNFSTQLQVFDSLGNAQTLTMDFTKTGTNAWSWAASVPAGAGTTTSTGTLAFDNSGNLQTPATNPAAPNISITGLADGAANLNFSFDPYNNGAATITQYAQASSVASNTQDGSAPSQISGVSIGNGGAVMASLSNGKQIQVGELAVANFTNPDSLIAVGNNDFQVSGLSSQAAIGTANSGGRGQIIGGATEASTVDISTEFTHLMTYQQGYEANSRVITTANSILQQTVNLISPNG